MFANNNKHPRLLKNSTPSISNILLGIHKPQTLHKARVQPHRLHITMFYYPIRYTQTSKLGFNPINYMFYMNYMCVNNRSKHPWPMHAYIKKEGRLVRILIEWYV